MTLMAHTKEIKFYSMQVTYSPYTA